jgi:hypothetical protein
VFDDVVHAVDGPDESDLAQLRERENRVAAVLEQARFVTGLGEPLDLLAGDLVAVLDSGGGLADIVRNLQASAAPASSYVPPASSSPPWRTPSWRPAGASGNSIVAVA